MTQHCDCLCKRVYTIYRTVYLVYTIYLVYKVTSSTGMIFRQVLYTCWYIIQAEQASKVLVGENLVLLHLSRQNETFFVIAERASRASRAEWAEPSEPPIWNFLELLIYLLKNTLSYLIFKTFKLKWKRNLIGVFLLKNTLSYLIFNF